MEHILIIHGEAELLRDLARDLRQEGSHVDCVVEGVLGLQAAISRAYELIVVNATLPFVDSYQVCRRIRAEGIQTPILMFGAQSSEAERMLGFEMGADQFADGQCGIGELMSRVRALLRRGLQSECCPSRLRIGEVLVDFRRHAATRDGHSVPLTPIEFEILRTLAVHRGEALHRTVILEEVWGGDFPVFPRTIDTHIGHLRDKLEEDRAHPVYLVGVRGVGYRLDA